MFWKVHWMISYRQLTRISGIYPPRKLTNVRWKEESRCKFQLQVRCESFLMWRKGLFLIPPCALMEAWVLPVRAGPFYDEKNITMLGPCSISQQQKDNNIHDRVSHSHRGPNTQPSVLPFCRCLVLPSCPGSTIALWFTGMHPVFQCIYSVYMGQHR